MFRVCVRVYVTVLYVLVCVVCVYVLSVWCICYMYNVYYIHEKSKGERETESPHFH